VYLKIGVFQGHSIPNEPKIKPVSKDIV